MIRIHQCDIWYHMIWHSFINVIYDMTETHMNVTYECDETHMNVIYECDECDICDIWYHMIWHAFINVLWHIHMIWRSFINVIYDIHWAQNLEFKAPHSTKKCTSATWHVIFQRDMTHTYKFGITHTHECDMTHTKNVIWRAQLWTWRDTFIWQHDRCYDAFIRLTLLIHVCETTHPHVWHDSFICAAWLIHMTRLFCTVFPNRSYKTWRRAHTHTHTRTHTHTHTHTHTYTQYAHDVTCALHQWILHM